MYMSTNAIYSVKPTQTTFRTKLKVISTYKCRIYNICGVGGAMVGHVYSILNNEFIQRGPVIEFGFQGSN